MMLCYLPFTVKKSVDYNSKQSPRDDRDLGLGVVRVEVNQFHDSLRLCHCSYGWCVLILGVRVGVGVECVYCVFIMHIYPLYLGSFCIYKLLMITEYGLS